MITSWLSTNKNMLSMAWHDKAYHCVAMTLNYHDLEKYLCILNSRKKDKLETRLHAKHFIQKCLQICVETRKSRIKRSTSYIQFYCKLICLQIFLYLKTKKLFLKITNIMYMFSMYVCNCMYKTPA